MTHKYYKYTPQFKHKVLEEYRSGVIGCGCKSLFFAIVHRLINKRKIGKTIKK